MPAHAYLEQQLVFHKRKLLWNFQQKVQFFPQSIFLPLYPLHVGLYIIKANYVPPRILQIRALVLNLSVGSDICRETIACSMGCCRLPSDCDPDTSWHLILTHFIIGAQKNTVLGPERGGGGKEKKLNYSVRCSCFNTHSKFWSCFIFLNNELCILAQFLSLYELYHLILIVHQLSASTLSCVISPPISATDE